MSNLFNFNRYRVSGLVVPDNVLDQAVEQTGARHLKRMVIQKLVDSALKQRKKYTNDKYLVVVMGVAMWATLDKEQVLSLEPASKKDYAGTRSTFKEKL